MFNPIKIKARSGSYEVQFETELLNDISSLEVETSFFVVDAKVAQLYQIPLKKILSSPKTFVLEATEHNKSIEQLIPLIKSLVEAGIKRNNVLVAIGGGIIQDITCFIGSVLMRGIEWRFVPTTLLSQADSCIGSKSSINLGYFKNTLGTFNPPSKILICNKFIDTLDDRDISSGIGEILKVHAIAGIDKFNKLADDFDFLMSDRQVLLNYVYDSLLIKKKFIEIDEFDKGIRNIFNYGHSFGHAIEAATSFKIPHGIAVSIGMDIANHIAVMRGLMDEKHSDRMHQVLSKNYNKFLEIIIPFDEMLSALLKDKKNTEKNLVLILPSGENAKIERFKVRPDDIFKSQCQNVLALLNS